jgi:hypothetical protein
VLVNYFAKLETLTWEQDEGDGVLFLLSFTFPLVLSFLLPSLGATFACVCFLLFFF